MIKFGLIDANVKVFGMKIRSTYSLVAEVEWNLFLETPVKWNWNNFVIGLDENDNALTATPNVDATTSKTTVADGDDAFLTVEKGGDIITTTPEEIKGRFNDKVPQTQTGRSESHGAATTLLIIIHPRRLPMLLVEMESMWYPTRANIIMVRKYALHTTA